MGGIHAHHGLLMGGLTDPYWANVVSLHNWPGTAGSTTLTDAKGKTWTAVGNAQIDTTYGQALLLDGAGDYTWTADHADFNLGSGLFTEEGFFRESVQNPIRQIIGQHDTTGGTGNANSSFLLLSDSGKLKFQVFMGGSFYTAANASTHATNTIHHYAAVRDASNVFRLYLNGVQVGSVTQSGTLNNSGQRLTIGAVMKSNSPDPGNYYFNGRVLARRLTVGVCRYPGGTTFTPPAYPFATS